MRGRFPERFGIPLLVVLGAAAAAPGAAPEPAAEADLAVTLEARAEPIVAGRVQIYELAVANHGPARATGVTLQHELPPGGIFLGAEPAALDCELLSGVLVECDLGTLEARSAIDLAIGVLMDHRAAGPVYSEAVVGGNEPDPDGANDEAELAIDVVAARAMVATARAGGPALATTLKEGETSVGLAVVDPAGGERAHSVEATGCRAASLTTVSDLGGSPSPEIAVLAAGFGGETRVVVIDSDSRELLGDHRVAGDWLAMDIAALESFAGGAAPELALLLRSRDGTELRLKVIDAATGAEVRDHLVAGPAGAPAEAVPVPIAMVPVARVGGAPSAELAIVAKSPGSGVVRVLAVDAGGDGRVRDLEMGTGLFPLAIVGLGDRGLGAGAPVARVAVLLHRKGAGGLLAWVLDVASGHVVGEIDYADELVPGGFAALRSVGASPAPEVALFGRVDPGTLSLSIKDTLTGATVSEILVASRLPAPVPLGLVALDRGGAEAAPALAVLFEPYGEPTRIQIHDPRPVEPLAAFTLP